MHGDWTFGGTWPHEPQWLVADGRHIHYVDVGPRDGQPVVLAHGNPTWSYLYRDLIAALAAGGYRAIAWDLLGFGRSEKPSNPHVYSVAAWVSHAGRLIDALELEGVTLVGHDWGAMVALAWGVRHPERVRRVVLLNGFTGSLPPWPQPLGLRLLAAPGVGAVMTRGLRSTVTGFLFRGGMRHPERLSPLEHTAYLAPHPTWSSRGGLRAAVRMIPWNQRSATPALGGEIDAELVQLGRKPALVVWGADDHVVHPGWLAHYRRSLPHAEVHELDGVGHFVQEDAPERLSPLVLEFLGRT